MGGEEGGGGEGAPGSEMWGGVAGGGVGKAFCSLAFAAFVRLGLLVGTVLGDEEGCLRALATSVIPSVRPRVLVEEGVVRYVLLRGDSFRVADLPEEVGIVVMFLVQCMVSDFAT